MTGSQEIINPRQTSCVPFWAIALPTIKGLSGPLSSSAGECRPGQSIDRLLFLRPGLSTTAKQTEGEFMKDNQKQAIMEAIRANPDDDVLRLKYADYVEEHPKRSKNVIEKRQAEFIRSQIENPGVLPSNVAAVNNAYTKRNLKTSWSNLPIYDWVEYDAESSRLPFNQRPTHQFRNHCYNIEQTDYHNGLLTRGRFSLYMWLDYFEKVLTNNPIQYIHITNMVPYWSETPRDFHWTVKNIDFDNAYDRIDINENCIDIPARLVDNCYENQFAHLKMLRPSTPAIDCHGSRIGLGGLERVVAFECEGDAYAWLSMKLIQYGLKRLGLGKKPT